VKRTWVSLAAGIMAVSVLHSFSEIKVRVIKDRAPIHAEARAGSYEIERLNKGTLLTLYAGEEKRQGWLYVYYSSPRWKARVVGFIRRDQVEMISDAVEAEQAQTLQPREMEAALDLPRARLFAFPAGDPGKEVFRAEERFFFRAVEQVLFPEVPPGRGFGRIQNQTREGKARPFLLVGAGFLIQPSLPPGRQFVLPLPALDSTEAFEIPDETGAEMLRKEQMHLPRDPAKKHTRDRSEPEAGEPAEHPPELAGMASLRRRNRLTLGLGFGPSLGGLGGFLQLQGPLGFAVHGGVGFYPVSVFYPEFEWVEGRILYSAGLKYYLPWSTEQVRPYFDLQYGGLSVEAVQVVTGMWYYSHIYENVQKTLWGPSFLFGVEMKMGRVGFNGALGLSYVTTEWEYWDQPLFLSADVGLVFYF